MSEFNLWVIAMNLIAITITLNEIKKELHERNVKEHEKDN